MTAYLVNPLCLFLGVWGTTTLLYLGGVSAGTFSTPQALTLGAVFLNIGTFSLGYLTWTLFRGLPSRAADFSQSGLLPTRPLTRDRLARALKFTLLVGLAILLMEFYRIVVLARHLDTSWYYLITHPMTLRLRLVVFIAGSMFQTSYIVILLSLANSVFSIGFVLLGVFLYLDRTAWKYGYLSAFLLISLVIGLLHVSRYEMTANILSLVFAYCFVQAQDRWESRGREGLLGSVPPRVTLDGARLTRSHFKLVIPIAVIALLFLAIDLLLRKSSQYGQASRLRGFAFHFYWYLASPLAAFNEFLRTFDGHCEWGRNTFFPLYKWLCRFHLAPPVDFSVYGEKVYLPFVANTYTYLRNFHEDFGLAGVALAPYILGWIAAAVRRQAYQYFHYLNLYIVLLLLILFSFYNYFLASNQLYLQILFGFLFFRYEWRDPADSASHA